MQPNLPDKSGDGGFTAGSGDGDNGLRLLWIKPCGGGGKLSAHIFNLHKADAFGKVRLGMRDNGGCACRQGLGHEAQPVGMSAGNGEKHISSCDLAAVHREAGNGNVRSCNFGVGKQRA